MTETQLHRAKALRKNATPAERMLWRILSGKKVDGVKFKRQQPIGLFIVDFAALEHLVVIEIDGGQHDSDGNRIHDEARSRWLASQGFKVVRFWNNEVTSNLEGVVEQIRSAIRTPSP